MLQTKHRLNIVDCRFELLNVAHMVLLERATCFVVVYIYQEPREKAGGQFALSSRIALRAQWLSPDSTRLSRQLFMREQTMQKCFRFGVAR